MVNTNGFCPDPRLQATSTPEQVKQHLVAISAQEQVLLVLLKLIIEKGEGRWVGIDYLVIGETIAAENAKCSARDGPYACFMGEQGILFLTVTLNELEINGYLRRELYQTDSESGAYYFFTEEAISSVSGLPFAGRLSVS